MTVNSEEANQDESSSLGVKIKCKTAIVGILGLGYVGLPLAQAFARAGFEVVGYDTSRDRIAKVLNGATGEPGIDRDSLAAAILSQQLKISSDTDVLKRADVFVICVPTPVTRNRVPDMSFVEAAISVVTNLVRPQQLVVLESTTYPGTTEGLLKGKLESTGLTIGVDLFAGFSPERVDPGNLHFTLSNTPKLVSGITEACLSHATQLYMAVVDSVVPVSKPSVAEMAKIFENTYRSVNIAMVNEFAMLCDRMGIDIWEVIAAAGTKPFGISVFKPGPGVGGHCIPCDPSYLSWKVQEFSAPARLIEVANEINRGMPIFVVEKLVRILSDNGKALRDSKIGILGVSYKADIPDPRESPAVYIASELTRRGAVVRYHDPFIPEISDPYGSNWTASSINLEELVETSDCLIITTKHSTVDYSYVATQNVLVFDAINALEGFRASRASVTTL